MIFAFGISFALIITVSEKFSRTHGAKLYFKYGELMKSKDLKTAKAFSTSWNNLDEGSIYTFDQFLDWINPLIKSDFESKNILELGCGNASLMIHCSKFNPESMTGVDLGDSVISAKKNLEAYSKSKWTILKHDLVTFYDDNKFDLVYCIGVLHHLKDPFEGLKSVVKNTKSGGRFHCWVYAQEGNSLIICLVDPLRKIVSRLPWWFNKYCIATPLVIPYYFYAKALSFISRLTSQFKFLPLYEYSLWIAKRDFYFFRHVAFDQLVTPQTKYISKKQISLWLDCLKDIDKNSTYIIMRNGNSWKFGGIKL